MNLALVSFYSRYYEPVAPGLGEEKGRLHDTLENALRPLGTVQAWRLVDSADTAARIRGHLTRDPPDVVIAVPMIAVFAELLEAALPRLDTSVILLNLEDAAHPFDLAATHMPDLIRHSHGLAVQAFANLLMRQGRAFEMVTGRIGDEGLADELRTCCAAAVLPRVLRTRRFALFGHVFGGMRDVMLDIPRLEERLGLRVETIPYASVLAAYRAVPAGDERDLNEQLRCRFRVASMPQEEWTRSLRLACAYRALCRLHGVAGGALNSHGASGLDDPEIGIMATLALSLMSEHGVSLAEVGDLQTGVALLLARLLGKPATYAELDYLDRDRWFIANSGELDLAMIDPQRSAWIRSNVNFRGRCGGGAAFDAALRPGPATLFSFTEGPAKTHRLIIAEGEILPERSEVLQLVNATFRPRGVAALDAYRHWCEGGAVHHAALSPGHLSRHLRKVARTLGLDCRVVS